MDTEKVNGSLDSETKPLPSHVEIKQDVPSVPLYCLDVKVDIVGSYGIVYVYLFEIV